MLWTEAPALGTGALGVLSLHVDGGASDLEASGYCQCVTEDGGGGEVDLEFADGFDDDGGANFGS